MIEDKIKTREEIRDISSGLKKQKKRIVFTNGCFDLIHYGHVKYLEDAKSRGDVLIIGLNSDASARRIKGGKRPLTDERDRARVLAALESVDFVVLFDEDDPLELIKVISPQALVKGGDWEEEKIVGNDFVKKNGGKVISVPYVKGYSTTDIIDRIVRRNK